MDPQLFDRLITGVIAVALIFAAATGLLGFILGARLW